MKIVAVDDEELLLERLVETISEVLGDCQIVSFLDSEEALEYCLNNYVDLVFCDISMSRVDGIELSKRIMENNPKVEVIFTTGYSKYSLEAWEVNASGFIMKPINATKIKKALSNLRHRIVLESNEIRIACFGNFEVYYEDYPLKFKYKKTKELLAYLISRDGAMCSKDEIIANLWDVDDKSDYYRKIKKDLNDVLASVGADNLLINQRGYLGISTEGYDCDYYKFKKGLVDKSIYNGEFMSQYSWAEPINASIYGKM